MLHEVKIYDGSGRLVNTISPEELDQRSTDFIRAQFTERDRQHILSLEEEEQTSEMSSHYMVA